MNIKLEFLLIRGIKSLANAMIEISILFPNRICFPHLGISQKIWAQALSKSCQAIKFSQILPTYKFTHFLSKVWDGNFFYF